MPLPCLAPEQTMIAAAGPRNTPARGRRSPASRRRSEQARQRRQRLRATGSRQPATRGRGGPSTHESVRCTLPDAGHRRCPGRCEPPSGRALCPGLRIANDQASLVIGRISGRIFGSAVSADPATTVVKNSTKHRSPRCIRSVR